MHFARRNTLSTSITKALIFHALSNSWLFSVRFCRFTYPSATEFLKACSIAPTQNTQVRRQLVLKTIDQELRFSRMSHSSQTSCSDYESLFILSCIFCPLFGFARNAKYGELHL